MNETKEQVQEQINLKTEKKGVKPIIVVFLCILFSAICGIGGWYIGSQNINKEHLSDNNNKTDNNKVEDQTKEKGDENQQENLEEKPETVVKPSGYDKEEVLTLSFGNTTKKLYSYYFIEKETIQDFDEKSFDAYVLRRKVYFESTEVVDAHILSYYSSKQEALNSIKTHNITTYNQLKDAKNNNSYALVEIKEYNIIDNGKLLTYPDGDTAKTYLFDLNGNILKSITTAYSATGLVGIYADKDMIKGKYYEKINKDDLYMEDKKLPDGIDYYLYPNGRIIDLYDNYFYYVESDQNCEWHEYKLIIENGKIKETKLNTFDEITDIEIAGASC